MNRFTEANTIEDAIIARLSKQPTNSAGMDPAEHSLSYGKLNIGKQWMHVRGSNLPREAGEVFVETWLKEAICRLNPDIAAEPHKADEVIHTLRRILWEARHSGLISANERFTEWLRAEKSMPLGKDGEHITINLINYSDNSQNHCVVSQQVQFHSAKTACFDIVLYVNGIPLVVGELKTPVRPAISWQDAASDFMTGEKNYWQNQSPFFVPNLLCFATEGKTFAFGAVNAGFKNWMPWHKTTDGDDISQSMNEVLKSTEGLLEPQTLLDLLQSFVLYSTTKQPNAPASTRSKFLPRYQQYEATKRIVGRVRSGRIRTGLIWHFQGSGKSLVMLYSAQMLKADPALKNPTVVVVVDRVDLDSQINAVFNNADVKNVTPVKSCKQLSRELKQDSRNILVTTIYKFDDLSTDPQNAKGLNPRKNVIVLVDEAHRTQEGTLGEKMRWALPNAFFFGLTGTPISSSDRNTFRLFGSQEDTGRYMNRYSYKQSIRDEATLPVKFEPRLVELRIDEEAITEGFNELAEANALSDEEKTQISSKASKLAHLLKSPKRMEAIACDIYEHFTNHVAPKGLKAMVVVYGRDACVRMYDLLSKRFGEGTCEVVMNISQGSIETDVQGDSRPSASDWERWTELGLPLNPKDFKRWQEIDSSPIHLEKVLNQYRDDSDPLKILIVTAKLLTGFDAAICYCMYLDKPLKDHTLLQAMCRTNRPYDESKQHGLIIDYLGVFENLAQALTYDPKEIEGVVEQLSAYKGAVPEALRLCIAFFEGVDKRTGGYEGLMAAQECLSSNDLRDQFAGQFNVLRKLWEALSPDPFLQPFREDYCWLAQVYDSVRPVGAVGSLMWQALGTETLRLIHQHTDIDRIRSDLSELIIDEKTIFTLNEEEQKKQARKVEIGILAKIRAQSNNPHYIELGERLERLREQYESGVLSSIQWLKELMDLARNIVRLDNGAVAQEKIVTDNKTALSELFKELRNDQTPEIISRIVNDIDSIVKATRFSGWQNSTQGNREMKQVLRKTLLKYQLHRDNDLFEKAQAYISEHY